MELWTWVVGITVWVVVCVAWWSLATRADYANLAAALACQSDSARTLAGYARCGNFKQSAARDFKSAIDRKAAISRVAGALVPAAALAVRVLIVRRRPRLTRS